MPSEILNQDWISEDVSHHRTQSFSILGWKVAAVQLAAFSTGTSLFFSRRSPSISP